MAQNCIGFYHQEIETGIWSIIDEFLDIEASSDKISDQRQISES
jgi:hypothetical protein